MRGAKKDVTATREARLQHRFKDARSFIAQPDSRGVVRTFLFGADRSELREWCFARDGYMCVTPNCETPTDWLQMDHIKSLGTGGDDSIHNVRTLCVNCHSRRHVRVKYGAKA